ncbi:uncharacterized protein KZ484_026598 isoform 3-T3 [Pholidichthys leucotaenia]
MEEPAGEASREDEALQSAQNDEGTSGDSVGPFTGDTTDGDGVFCGPETCRETFSEEAAHSEHRHQHLLENMHSNKQMDELPDAEKDNETHYFCTVCSLSFNALSEFHLHMETKHDPTSQKEPYINPQMTKQRTYECEDCGKTYGVIGHLLNHRRSHRQPSKSLFHDIEHLQKKAFQCESCGRSYSRASALDAHRRCHEEKLVKSKHSSGDALSPKEPIEESKPGDNQTEDCPKLFPCVCGKSFSSSMSLKTHQRFSRNSQCRPVEMKQKSKKSGMEFFCNECNKYFSGHLAFINHQRWHANQSNDSAKKFSCEECGKSFMTLAFYYRHQRTAHNDETPAKSFQHQLYQLQKKAFECKNCGLKFSRASALHSHERYHTDVFQETEKGDQIHCSPLPQDQMSKGVNEEKVVLKTSTEEKIKSDNLPPSSIAEESCVNENDEESYEPGDFNVQVISASESEDEPITEPNPDLELLCESDQEAEGASGSFASKPETDLKIVQVDYDQPDQDSALMARDPVEKMEERFDCPDCYRWFTNPSSLRVHRMWHGIRKRRQQSQDKQKKKKCKECGLKFTNLERFKTHRRQHAIDPEEPQTKDQTLPPVKAPSNSVDTEKNQDKSCSGAAAIVENISQRGYTCHFCAKYYVYLVSYRKHLLLHNKRFRKDPESTEETEGKEENMQKDAEVVDHDSNGGSEPVNDLEITKPPDSSDPAEEMNAETLPSQTTDSENGVECKDCGLTFPNWEDYSTHLHQHALELEETPMENEMVPAEELAPETLDTGEDGDEAMSCETKELDMNDLPQTKLTDDVASPSSSMWSPREVYSCSICGKSYTYLSSFQKHQQIHENKTIIKSPSEQILRKYECPECGMVFIRRTRLIGHLRVHRRQKLNTSRRCDTCNKMFPNKQVWMAHIHMHTKNPFWCLSCVKGFTTEALLDEHLQSHNQTKQECNNLNKSAQPSSLDSTRNEMKPYQCAICKKNFSHPGKLILHRKKHARLYAQGSASIPVKKLPTKTTPVTNSKEDEGICTTMEQLSGKEENMLENESQTPSVDAECGDLDNSDSDCGEPVHCLKLSNPPESKSEDAQPQAGEELDKGEPQESIKRDKHKYWEWECLNCDMGFDDVAKLHLHYIKHATGEVPMLQEESIV